MGGRLYGAAGSLSQATWAPPLELILRGYLGIADIIISFLLGDGLADQCSCGTCVAPWFLQVLLCVDNPNVLHQAAAIRALRLLSELYKTGEHHGAMLPHSPT